MANEEPQESEAGDRLPEPAVVKPHPSVTGTVGTLPRKAQRPDDGRRLFALREDVPHWLSGVASLLCVLIVAGLWYWVTYGEYEERILGYSQLPSISETWHELPSFWDSDAPELHLLDNTLISLKRVLLGFSLALVVGIPIGVASGCFALVRSFFAPLILFGRNIPVAALTALVFALFGTGELEKVMFIFIACVAFIMADTIDAVGEVSQRYVETALTLGASRLQIMFKVLVPLAMPMVFNSLRVLFGLAFGYIMLVEIVQEGSGAGGLGFLLNRARGRGGHPEIMVIILLTIPLVAWAIDQILFIVQCWLFRWKYGREAERSSMFRLSRSLLRLFWKTA
jgi:ABC-type nitrate/sulfonate/bicarbonate transport system permease component